MSEHIKKSEANLKINSFITIIHMIFIKIYREHNIALVAIW